MADTKRGYDKEACREYYLKNKEYIIQRMKQYYKDNREYILAREYVYHQRKRAASGKVRQLKIPKETVKKRVGVVAARPPPIQEPIYQEASFDISFD